MGRVCLLPFFVQKIRVASTMMWIDVAHFQEIQKNKNHLRVLGTGNPWFNGYSLKIAMIYRVDIFYVPAHQDWCRKKGF